MKLAHKNHNHLFFCVDGELRANKSAPSKPPHRSEFWQRRFHAIDREAESEALVGTDLSQLIVSHTKTSITRNLILPPFSAETQLAASDGAQRFDAGASIALRKAITPVRQRNSSQIPRDDSHIQLALKVGSLSIGITRVHAEVLELRS